MPLYRVVCFVKVDRIYSNICLGKLLQRVVGSEDQFVTFYILPPGTNYIRASAAEVMSFTCVNVHHMSICDELKVLTGQLLCQEDARCHNYDSLRSLFEKLLNGIKNTNVGFTTASRENTDALGNLAQGIKSDLLMRAKLEQGLRCVWDYYSRKGSPKEPPVPLEELFQPNWFSKGIVVCKGIMAHIMRMVNRHTHPFTQFFMIVFHQLNCIKHVI